MSMQNEHCHVSTSKSIFINEAQFSFERAPIKLFLQEYIIIR